MDEKIKIIFDTCSFKKSLDISSTITIKDLFYKFLNDYHLDIDKTKEDIIFLFNGGNLYDKLYCTLSSVGLKQNSIIIVSDQNNLLNPEIAKLENKININQDDRRNNREHVLIKGEFTEFLKDMAVYGFIIKGKIQAEYNAHPENFISINEAMKLKGKDDILFILGLLGKYLELLGIKVYIEVNESHSNKLSNNNILQYLVNGLMSKKKYYLTFDGNPYDLGKSENDANFRNYFIDKLGTKLSNMYKINKNEIIITYCPQRGTFRLIVVFKTKQNIVLNLNDLQNNFYSDPNLKIFTRLEESAFIDGIKLNKSMLDYHGDCKKENWEPHYYEKRGGECYYPPIGWDRYGLKVWRQYDNGNNDWLSSDNRKGEWCIAYYSFVSWEENNKINEQYEDDDDENHPNKKIGRGTYVTQYPKKLEEYAVKIDNYQIGFAVRVKPESIRKPSTYDFYWVVNGTPDEIRPFGIIIKDLKG